MWKADSEQRIYPLSKTVHPLYVLSIAWHHGDTQGKQAHNTHTYLETPIDLIYHFFGLWEKVKVQVEHANSINKPRFAARQHCYQPLHCAAHNHSMYALKKALENRFVCFFIVKAVKILQVACGKTFE